ncbi:MAG: sugar phosphate isomerase/epimerase family protein [Chloroflexota bacterium]
MASPVALQLYTVRDAIARQGYEAIVRQVAEIGYAGVETAGFPGTTPQDAGKLFEQLGLAVSSIHKFPIPGEADLQEVVDTLGALCCQRLVTGAGPNDYKSRETVRTTCEKINAAAALLAPYRVSVGVHNHWWEYLEVGEKYVYEWMLEWLSPDIFFEVDTYWVKTAGVDPAAVLARLGKRAPLLHIKDGPAQQKVPQLAVGEGLLDFPAIVDAGHGNTEWMIVELDSCATDMLAAVRKSYAFLIAHGLARGR